jgi:hypothetical protein
MRVSLNYHEILEEILLENLEWLREEFEILFKSKKGKYTSKDKKVANNILDYILEHASVYDNILLLNLLNETIENIENHYLNLF